MHGLEGVGAGMRVAIDVGCWPGGGDSIGHLIRELGVTHVFGFDPHPETPKLNGEEYGGALVWTFRHAAHERDGHIGWRKSGYGSYTTREKKAPQVATVDLAAFIKKLIAVQDEKGEPVEYLALKLDCEGDEFPILRHLIATGIIHVLDLLWVEWHGNDLVRKELLEWVDDNTDIEVHEWTM